VSYAGHNSDIPIYINAVKRELAINATGQRIKSIYFGGGTPSLLTVAQLDDLMCAVRSNFALDGSAEVTIEANPGTIDGEYLSVVRSLGINRINLGIQSLDDKELKLLGRIHTAEEGREALQLAKEAGFDNINLDVIYGVPGRTMSQWRHMLQEVVSLTPQHLSLYPLTLEGDEPLCGAISRGDVGELDVDETADQYEVAEQILTSHGYTHYEISNWARKRYECKHNMAYWLGRSYLGVGVAAHSYMDGCRYANTPDLDAYLAAFTSHVGNVREMEEQIGPELKLSEAVILGLRLTRGIDVGDINSRFNVDLLYQYRDQLEELVALELVECNTKDIKLTPRGRLLGNEVFWRFLPK
jgi:oxygen-independent coproporphyrinogen-3 oxidase